MPSGMSSQTSGILFIFMVLSKMSTDDEDGLCIDAGFNRKCWCIAYAFRMILYLPEDVTREVLHIFIGLFNVDMRLRYEDFRDKFMYHQPAEEIVCMNLMEPMLSVLNRLIPRIRKHPYLTEDSLTDEFWLGYHSESLDKKKCENTTAIYYHMREVVFSETLIIRSSNPLGETDFSRQAKLICNYSFGGIYDVSSTNMYFVVFIN